MEVVTWDNKRTSSSRATLRLLKRQEGKIPGQAIDAEVVPSTTRGVKARATDSFRLLTAYTVIVLTVAS